MALKNSGSDLADAITSVLTAAQGPEKCAITIEEVDEDGNKSTKTYALGGGDGTISFSTLLNPKLYSTGVNDNDVTGVEALASIIADKVIVHLMENFELAATKRYDQLETDFNTFLTVATPIMLALASVPMSGNAVAGGLAAAMTSVGGPARGAKTAIMKSTEKIQTMGGELL